jgi:hypothetical protein
VAVFRALREATRAALSTDLYISTIIRDETGASKGIGAAIAKGLSASASTQAKRTAAAMRNPKPQPVGFLQRSAFIFLRLKTAFRSLVTNG